MGSIIMALPSGSVADLSNDILEDDLVHPYKTRRERLRRFGIDREWAVYPNKLSARQPRLS